MPKVQVTKGKIEKLDFVNIENASNAKNTINIVKDNAEYKKYLQIIYLTRDLYLKYTKNIHNSLKQRQHNLEIGKA